MIDLSQVPFVDGHMHPPLRVRPQTVEEYRWPWFEGLPSESAQVTELVPYRWAIRQLADELGCAADERTVVRHTRELDPMTWLATVCEPTQTLAQVGTWYHLVGTFDTAVIQLYVNGALEGTRTHVAAA